MQAVVYDEYGAPDVLQLEEVPQPVPGPGEVLIKIYATTVSAVDTIFRRGKELSARFFTGLTRPSKRILGSEFAGVVSAVGRDVVHFKPGDPVYGATSDLGAHAEYICLPEQGALTAMPPGLTYAEAAAIPGGALTALPFLRDTASIQPGQKVLINGASGSVGAYAVQLAVYYGAEVTGVCSSANVDLVKSLGAQNVIDYTKEDFTRNGEQYDIIFDTAAKSSFSQCKDSLRPGGVFLAVKLSLPILLQMAWTSRFGSKRAKLALTGLRPAAAQAQDLRLIKELVEAGTITPVIGQCYPFAQIVEAHRYVDTGHKRGSVVIAIKDIDDVKSVEYHEEHQNGGPTA
jgi:NADPH:quinone reductase-like Zn-dependent oxidoreductase